MTLIWAEGFTGDRAPARLWRAHAHEDARSRDPALSDGEQGAAEGAAFIAAHLIVPPAKAFDDFAGAKVDEQAVRRVLGLD